ncbi:translation elongation factor Ts [Candidatus Riesia pediculicola]|uniref:Elongation factor Ts n=1 Tax=Riesia pediculicola (strain USDA) TaxID=515618 RepID=D4G8E8_RIEPU|nr:translation elongation factor Ts [Candidatus Riesia pediculicola]ADD79658.1 translation elongation factor Ts [Candidatus Riesia pediculicola USDA]ARC53835.1 hypothetical protein AOE55_01590 [Candidatus Riesia pediculicola]QOJ86467.1 translation elongation factor Ts [Candidatus Riesia pediculicola]
MSKKINSYLNLIKEIREKTGANILECRAALNKFPENIDLAINLIQKNKKKKAKEKYGNKTQVGSIGLKISEDRTFGVLLKIKCETEFLARSFEFLKFKKKIMSSIVQEKIFKICSIRKYFTHEINEMILQSKENVKIENFSILEGRKVYGYLHRNQIGVLVHIENSSKIFGKQIAMQIVANESKYIDRSDMIKKTLKKKKDLSIETKKNDIISDKSIESATDCSTDNSILVEQPFIFDTQRKVWQLLQENKSKIVDFIIMKI